MSNQKQFVAHCCFKPYKFGREILVQLT